MKIESWHSYKIESWHSYKIRKGREGYRFHGKGWFLDLCVWHEPSGRWQFERIQGNATFSDDDFRPAFDEWVAGL